MFGTTYNKKDIERQKIVDSELEKIKSGIAALSRERYYVNNAIELAARGRDYTKESELMAKAMELQQKNARLFEQEKELQREKEQLDAKVEKYVRDSLRGTPEFKQFDRAERSLQSLEEREKELKKKLRPAERERNEFKNRGADANFPHDDGRIWKYDKRVAELDAVVNSLESELKKIRQEIETFRTSELAPASSALYQRESQVLEQLMSE